MYGIARDVNDRIESEISLNKTASFYKNIIEDNLSGFYRLNTNSVIIEANNSFAKALGYKNKKQVIGKKTEKLYKVSTDENFIDNIIRKKKLINHESHVILHTGEEKFFYRYSHAVPGFMLSFHSQKQSSSLAIDSWVCWFFITFGESILNNYTSVLIKPLFL